MPDDGLTFEQATQLNAGKSSAPKSSSAAPKPDDDGGISFEDASAMHTEAPERKSLLEKIALLPHHALMGIGEVVDKAINPRNWAEAAKQTVKTVGAAGSELVNRPGEALSEVNRGAQREAALLPAQLLDLPIAGLDQAMQYFADAPARTGYPSQKLEEAITKDDPNILGKPREALTPGAQTFRDLGTNIVAGMPAGPSGLATSAAMTVPMDVAERTAPNDPAFPLLAGAGTASIPALARKVAGKIAPLASKLPAVSQEGIQAELGKAVNEQTGGQIAKTNTQVPGVALTTAQTDPRLKAMQDEAVKKDPKLAAALEQREKENIKGLRGAIETTGGKGSPDSARALAEEKLLSAEERANRRLLGVRGPALQSSMSDEAGNLLSAKMSAARTEAAKPWEALKAFGQDANIETKPLAETMKSWEKGLSESDRGDIKANAEFNRKLNLIRKFAGEPEEGVEIIRNGVVPPPQVKPEVNIFELQDVRSSLGSLARRLSSGMDPNMRLAKLASDAADRVGKYIDGFDFKDPRVGPVMKQARESWKAYADRYLNPLAARKALGHDARGEELVTPAELLGKFTLPGPKGRDAISDLMKMDNSPEMQELVASHLAADLEKVPKTTKATNDWLRSHTEALIALDKSGAPHTSLKINSQTSTSWFEKFRQIVDDRAAVEYLHKSPLGKVAELSPQRVASKILGSADPLDMATELRSQFLDGTREGRDAWRGMRRAYADELIHKVTNVAGDAIDADKLAGFVGRFGKLNDIMLSPGANKLIANIQDAARRIEATSGKIASIPVERTLMDYVVDGLVGGIAGYLTGGLSAVGGGVALGAGAVTDYTRAMLRSRSQAVLREALLDPDFAQALSTKATPKAYAALPSKQRALLDDLMRAVPGMVPMITRQEPKAPPEPTRKTIPQRQSDARPTKEIGGQKYALAAPKPTPAVVPKPEAAAAPTPKAAIAKAPVPAPVKEKLEVSKPTSSGRRSATVNGRKYTITPTKNGRYIVEIAEA